METRSIAFTCIQERMHSSTCLLNAWQDVLSDHAHVGVVPKEHSTRDLRQPSTGTKLIKWMCFKRQQSVCIICIIKTTSLFENAAESAPRGSHGR